MIEDEIAASSAFADWKILTENEEVALNRERDDLEDVVCGLETDIEIAQDKLTTLQG
jgi:hypothetical protein